MAVSKPKKEDPPRKIKIDWGKISVCDESNSSLLPDKLIKKNIPLINPIQQYPKQSNVSRNDCVNEKNLHTGQSYQPIFVRQLTV